VDYDPKDVDKSLLKPRTFAIPLSDDAARGAAVSQDASTTENEEMVVPDLLFATVHSDVQGIFLFEAE